MLTKEIVFGTSTNFSTVGTDLASHERINLLNFNSFDVGFVLNKTLQLVKTPITEHSVESFAFSLLPNSFKVFHTNLVSFIVGNNAFADVVISPCHELFFTTTKLLQESLSTSCAFGLEFTTQEHEFVFYPFGLFRIIKLAIASDSKVVYSDINAQNSNLRTTIQFSGVEVFRECEYEEASSFIVNTKEALTNFPSVKIFLVANRDIEWNLNSTFDCGQAENIIFNTCTAREIVSHTHPVNDWFGLDFLDNSTGLFDTGNGELTLQSSLPQRSVNKGMEFNIIVNFTFPCLVNAELECFMINFESPNNNWIRFNSYSCTDSCSHKYYGNIEVFKFFGKKSSGGEKSQFLPQLKQWVSLRQII